MELRHAAAAAVCDLDWRVADMQGSDETARIVTHRRNSGKERPLVLRLRSRGFS